MNFENLTSGEPQYLAKIRVYKVDYFILPLFLVPKFRSEVQNEWKTHIYIFSTFGSKIKYTYMGVFSTHFVPLISILAPKIMEE